MNAHNERCLIFSLWFGNIKLKHIWISSLIICKEELTFPPLTINMGGLLISAAFTRPLIVTLVLLMLVFSTPFRDFLSEMNVCSKLLPVSVFWWLRAFKRFDSQTLTKLASPTQHRFSGDFKSLFRGLFQCFGGLLCFSPHFKYQIVFPRFLRTHVGMPVDFFFPIFIYLFLLPL